MGVHLTPTFSPVMFVCISKAQYSAFLARQAKKEGTKK